MKWTLLFYFYSCTLYFGTMVSSATTAIEMTSKTARIKSDFILCYCEECPFGKEVRDYCDLKRGGQCFSAIEGIYNNETREIEPVRSFGCISDSEQAVLQCKGNLVPAFYGRAIECCNYTDFCNKDLLPTYIPRDIDPSSNTYFGNYLFIVTLLLATSALVGIILAYFCFRNWYSKDLPKKFFSGKPYGFRIPVSHHVTQDGISTTGSGVGKPLLVQTTISRQFKRNYCLGKGQFTEVYVGEWNASKIVEKVFATCSEDRWIREKNIYETAFLRYENVLGYIASDILKSGLRAIYTDYHEIGSLHDYLDTACLNRRDFFALVRSAVNGIAQLHTEIWSTEKRPAVAHRDITSKNFLINANKECVISNFEIAVMHISTDDILSDEPDLTLGTPRYMAPEVVNGTINEFSFDALKKADVYSLGLVLYEICQRCDSTESKHFKGEDHSLPFANMLPFRPSLDDMRTLYSMKKLKEESLFIPPRWDDDKLLKSFQAILSECLYEHPKSRNSALRIRKRIDNLISATE